MATFINVRIEVPYALTLPTMGSLVGGEPNPFYPLILLMNDSTQNRYYDVATGMYVYNAQVMIELLTPQILELIVSQGGDVYSYPSFIKVAAEDATHASLETDAETWADWWADSPGFKPDKKEDGFYYVPTTAFATSDPRDYLPASEAFALGVELFTALDVRALGPYVEPVDEPEIDEPAEDPAEEPTDDPEEQL